MEQHQRSLQEEIELKAYANGLVDGLIVGFSVGIVRIWRFDVCVPTPLTSIWTLCKAQSAFSGLQHRVEELSLSMPYSECFVS